MEDFDLQRKTLEEAKELHSEVKELRKSVAGIINEAKCDGVAHMEVAACWRAIAKGESKSG